MIISQATNQGRRQYQEDVGMFRNVPGGHCVAVFDGMGGHKDGDKASALACKLLNEYLDEGMDCRTIAGVQKIAARLNDDYQTYSWGDNPHLDPEAGTTVAIAFVYPEEILTIYCGDSTLNVYPSGDPDEDPEYVSRHQETPFGSLMGCLIGGKYSKNSWTPETAQIPFYPGAILLVASDGIETIGARFGRVLIGPEPDGDSAFNYVAGVLKGANPHQDNVTVLVVYHDGT